MDPYGLRRDRQGEIFIDLRDDLLHAVAIKRGCRVSDLSDWPTVRAGGLTGAEVKAILDDLVGQGRLAEVSGRYTASSRDEQRAQSRVRSAGLAHGLSAAEVDNVLSWLDDVSA